MQDLKLNLVQTDTVWERPADNLQKLERLLDHNTADLVVLPEMFSTGFTMNAKALAEPMNGQTVGWMKQLAKRLGAVVTGSVIITESGNYFNRLLWITPTGECDYYDKRHLFGLMGESEVYQPGQTRKIFTVGNWRVCPQICYDLRFPVWCRNQDDYDLLLVVASWPTVRQSVWNILLQARAIENQSYVVATNRVGRDGSNLEFTGDSQAINPLGERVAHLGVTEGTTAVTLQWKELQAIREKLPFLRDRDSFAIAI